MLLSPITSPLVYATAVHLQHISALYDAFGRFSPVLPYFALHYFGLDKTGPNICNGDDVKMVTSNLSAHINDVLRYVGITRNMNAYIILSQALTMIAEDEDRLRAVEKEIYTPIADKKLYESKAVQSSPEHDPPGIQGRMGSLPRSRSGVGWLSSEWSPLCCDHARAAL